MIVTRICFTLWIQILMVVLWLPIFPINVVLAAQPEEAVTTDGLSIANIIVGEDAIQIGETQLIEVVIKNEGDNSHSVSVSLTITLPNRNVITFGKRPVYAKEKTEHRLLFDYPVPTHLGGDFTVGAKVYNSQGKVMATTIKKQGRYFFAIDPNKKRRAPTRIRRIREVEAKEVFNLDRKEDKKPAVVFDPPDLTWEEVSIPAKVSVLRGETTHVRLILANVGGDIATDVEYSVKWYFSQRPKRMVRLYWDKFKVIAPGERKVLELPVTIPDIEQRGEYKIQVTVDEPNYIKEIDENNNTGTTVRSIIFSDVAQVFPEDGYSFAEDGLFKFQWRSMRYNQFKVQISSDYTFTEEDQTFELPKGDKWTPNTSIKPMEGEMPALAIALMNTAAKDHLYWRVKGKDSDGKVSFSVGRKFYIDLKPAGK